MPVQTATQEVNSFSKGIITEASPLTFPDNASINENNLVIGNDGSRRRRLGMNYEPSYDIISTGFSTSDILAYSSFVWKTPGGFTDEEFIVVQIGSKIFIFSSTTRPISNNVIYSTDFGVNPSVRYSMTSVDGMLIVANNTGDIKVLDWDGTDITLKTGRLKIRDLFGVEDIIGSNNLLEGTDVGRRPTTLPGTHTYNLRNQTFALPRRQETGVGNSDADPIASFKNTGSVYPSNSDSVVVYLYADANNEADRNIRRFFAKDLKANPLGTNRAPVGYFIIDALDRGTSRLSEIDKLHSQYGSLGFKVTSLPLDSTPDGASTVASFAGRVWFGGFSSKLTGGDSRSPRMSSFILFSRLVKSSGDIFQCYQEGDPTSSEAPDLLDTDGGFIRLDGAYNIQKLVNVGDSLMVVAENGVWRISGGSGYGFKATDYLTSKVTEHGSIAPDSVVVVDNTIMYWSDDGIYHVSPNQYGDWVATNLTTNTIQSMYDDISFTIKRGVQGLFDSYQRKVRWLYNATISADGQASEIILDVNLGAFYTSSVMRPSVLYPMPLSLIKVPPFTIGTEDSIVIDSVSNTVVTASGDIVVATTVSQVSSLSETLYLTAVPTNGLVNFTFSYYYDDTFKDWKSYNDVGVDANAYLLTGWTGFGDFQRQKQIPYMTVYSLKTETGFADDFIPVNPSSIITQSQWSWTDREDSGKWGTPFQAYRHNRLWLPTSIGSGFDDGNYVVKTKNKLRGRGNVLSVKFSTEPDKDFKLLGWSFIVNVSGNP